VGEERGERGGSGDLWGNCRKCRECNPQGWRGVESRDGKGSVRKRVWEKVKKKGVGEEGGIGRSWVGPAP